MTTSGTVATSSDPFHLNVRVASTGREQYWDIYTVDDAYYRLHSL